MNTDDEHSKDDVPFIINAPAADVPYATLPADAGSDSQADTGSHADMEADGSTAGTKAAASTGGSSTQRATRRPRSSAQAGGQQAPSVWAKLTSDSLPEVSLRELLFGDYFIGSFLRSQVLYIAMAVVLGIVYITNRYGAQRDIIAQDHLRAELADIKNYALTQHAERTRRTRQSAIEQLLRARGDSTLHSPLQPPFAMPMPRH